LGLTRNTFLAIHRFLRFRHKDLSIKRNPVKNLILRLLKMSVQLLEDLIISLSSLEWRLLKNRKSGTAQYLVFEKV